MKQKTLNKMNKYCKLKGWRFGQLIANLMRSYDGTMDSFFIADEVLEREFNKLWEISKPTKIRGGYYPKGKNFNPQLTSNPQPTTNPQS